jgi:Fe-S oxidoreductase
MEFGIKNITFILVFFGAGIYFIKNFMKVLSYLKFAKDDNRFDRIGERLINTLIVAIFQKKILRDKKAGPVHAGIFWGFLILLFSVINSIFTGFGINHFLDFLGPVFSIITILTDVFSVLIILAVTAALLRRFVFKVKRLKRKDHSQTEAGLILLMIFFIVTSLLFENASLIIMGGETEWAVRPLASALSGIISPSFAPILFEIGWWLHIVLILVFMNVLPFSKHLHVLTSVPNVFFSNLEPTNTLKTIDFEDESIEQYGASDIEHFSWKTIFDSYTCTECGRCTDVCPANQTGKVLDPREIMVQIRKRTMDKAPILIKLDKLGKTSEEYDNSDLTDAENEIMGKSLIGDYVNPEALWQCTSCSACMQECPVNIEHVPAIIDMRRNLVMMEAEFPDELQTPFNNIENNAAPWAFGQDQRADWAEGTGVETAAEKQDFDVLFWVGCSGSFDDRAKEVTKAFAKLMQIAGVNFAILGTEEACSGDPARRGGNEYLADSYVRMNIETMSQYNFKKIVTTCPHCFNTLKNEYPQFSDDYNYEVIHHTKFLKQLTDSGKLQLDPTKNEDGEVVIHDSCYTGRLNDIYEEPRDLLKIATNKAPKEAGRTGDRGMCCGAGGGQMFMEETEGKRVNIERTEELLATGAETVALGCPFCMTMITDGIKEKEADVKVKDIAEVMLGSVKES